MASKLPRATAERTELRKRSFDRVARLYHQARPDYPERLIDAAVRLSGIPKGGRILEIGPGTGQATLAFARRGFSILALEIGPRLTRLCRRNLRGFPNVEIRNLAFEQLDSAPEAFDIVLAASSFHWLPHQTAYRRCAQLLKPMGALCLLWHFRGLPAPALRQSLQEVYLRYAPQLAVQRVPEERIARQQRKLISSGLFNPVTVRTCPSQDRLTAEQYVALMRTMSDHAILPPSVRSSVFRALRRVIDQHGGTLVRPVTTTLFVARKRDR